MAYSACFVAIAGVVAYLLGNFFYEIFFSPLAYYPGPRLAAASRLYEAYHVLVKNDWFENLKRLHKRYGPVVRIGPNELHFVDHEFCLAHHRRPDLWKCNNYYGLLETLLGGLAHPKKHVARAAGIRPLFSGEMLAKFCHGELDVCLDKLQRRLKTSLNVGDGLRRDNAQVNLTHFLWACTNDVMISFITGEDPKFLESADLAGIHDRTRAFSAIDLATVLRCMPPVKFLFDVFPQLRRWSPLGWLDELVKNQLKSITGSAWHPEKGHPHPSSLLASLWDQLQDETLVVQESAQAIFIGNESLLSNLTFLIHYLMQNPECVKSIRAELDTLDLGTYGSGVWRDPRVLQLRYLDAVCRESTRMSAPGWHRQPRQLPTPVQFGTDLLPPMTSLSFTLSMLAEDPGLYPEPGVFKPERWLGTNEEARKARNSSVAFGTGTRTCLGQHIARVVLRKTVACLVYNFDISLWDPKKDAKEHFRYLDTYPKKGYEGYLQVKLQTRF